MKPAATLAAYAVALAAALGGGAALGAAVGPLDVGDVAHQPASQEVDPTEAVAGGLQVAERGYRLQVASPVIGGGTFAFKVAGLDGGTLRSFDESHDRRMHLIVASRDLRTFRHLHPTMTEDGTWVVDVDQLPAGAYRAFADFKPAGDEPLTLGSDVVVPGAVDAAPPLTPSRTTTVDGYRIDLSGDVAANRASTVTLSVSSEGAPVRPDPYLGARGHLVALRAGDLAYLHVHPLHAGGSDVPFSIEVPSAGTYALFFDFSHGGAVHTASFVVDVAAAGGEGTQKGADGTDHGSDGHTDH